ncbi:MAG: hypothetical protein FJZ01_02375 [Candidatus Sericytochromatia bacterium]|nr:hypothetical protein [Candidatus Tanganyikabacteria bacterium]
MATWNTLRLMLGALLATAVGTAGCDAFSGLMAPPAKTGKKAKAPAGSLTRHEATVPINRESQIASVRGGVEAIKTTMAQTSSSLSDSYKTALATPQGKYAVAALFRTMGIKAAIIDSYGTEVSYDDASLQITRVKSGTYEISANVRGAGGSARGADLTLVRSQDGTTGDLAFTIDAEKWLDTPRPPSRPGYAAPTPPPFQIFYDQLPDMASLERLEGKVGVNPRGDGGKRVEFAGRAEDFKQPQGLLRGFGAPMTCAEGTFDKSGDYVPGECVPGDPAKAPRFPHKIATRGKLPRFEYEQSFTYASTGETSGKFDINGDFNLETDKGWNSWSIANTFKGDSKLPGASVVEVNWENHTMKYRFAGTFRPLTVSADQRQATGFILEGKFTSTSGGAKLAEIRFTSDEAAKGGYPRIEFANGDSMVLKPQEFMPVMPGGGPMSFPGVEVEPEVERQTVVRATPAPLP